MGNGRALIIGESDGIVKVVAEKGGPILGVHIAGPWATELPGRGVPGRQLGALPEEVAAFVHPHPTLSEVFARPPSPSPVAACTADVRTCRRNRRGSKECRSGHHHAAAG